MIRASLIDSRKRRVLATACSDNAAARVQPAATRMITTALPTVAAMDRCAICSGCHTRRVLPALLPVSAARPAVPGQGSDW